MKTIRSIHVMMIACVASAPAATASVRYVNVNSTNPTPPYTNWATAANVIQDAIDVASAGDEIVVTNGIYQTGGLGIDGVASNRVAVTKAITVRSVNGPTVTMICGYRASNSTFNVRCVYLTNSAVIAGFTLTNGGVASGWFEGRGGGVWCESASSVVSNCVLTGNFALFGGGGAYRGTLNNCTLTGNSVVGGGGGAAEATLNNCLVVSNSAPSGAGVSGGTLNNCALLGNTAAYSGGAAFGSTLNNCTLTGNSAGNSALDEGGGAFDCVMNNCLAFYNRAPRGANYAGGVLNYCATTPLPPSGNGNVTSEPQLVSAYYLSSTSPCRGAGSGAYVNGVDIEGEAWNDPPSIGCDEIHLGAETGPLAVSIEPKFTNFATGFEASFTAIITGHPSANQWEFGDGTVLSNRPYAMHIWTNSGDYAVVFRAFNESFPGGISATTRVHVASQSVFYVAADSTNPVAPFNSWATAAQEIQDAVDASPPGGLVLVSNGVYRTGGRALAGTTNRVAITNPLTLRSVNGPEVTIISGYQAASATNGNGAVRCAYLASDAALVGFTLTNGATAQTEPGVAEVGGGVLCESVSAIVSNCIIRGNSAPFGGGAFRGTLNNCALLGNSSNEGGGAYWSVLNNCALTGNTGDYGGGAYDCSLNNCVLNQNSASFGGGVFGGTLSNCVLSANAATGVLSGYGGGAHGGNLFYCILTGNSASSQGGGAFGGTLNNCILTGNSAQYGGGAQSGYEADSALNNCIVFSNSASVEGGGVIYGRLNNSILYDNNAPIGPNHAGTSFLNYSCTTPLPTNGVGNITNAPLFVDAAGDNFRLQANSPCINAGRNTHAPIGLDLDGNPRVVGGTVDIGAYEFQSPESSLSYAWLQQYGFPTDGSADLADSDGDGHNNWQEWHAGTDPTNSFSVLRLLAPTIGTNGVIVRWQSVSGLSYRLERNSDLALPGFETVSTNMVGQSGVTAYSDTNASATHPFFYRVAVDE